MRGAGAFAELGGLPVPGLTGTRRVRLWIPPSDPPHPVAYLWDGQNLFGDEGSFAGGWHVHQALEARARRRLPAPLVVAIDHGGDERIGDFSPWPSRLGPARADALLDFVVGTLKPRIDREHSTLAGPAATLVGGSSMAGLLSLYALLRHPEVFGLAMAMSPTLWVADRAIFEEARRRPLAAECRVYLDVGGKEVGGRAVPIVRDFAEVLARRGLAERLMVRVDPRGDHHERAWRRRLPRALRFLLDGKR